jgi:hypothetical protein
MSSAEEVFRQIETDRAVREREVRLVGNAARNASTAAERDMLLRTSVLLTYAHLEGFCKFALTAYASAINAMKLPCKEASIALVAASLTKLFGALRHPQSKHYFFIRVLPDDAKLHLTAREREFVENLEVAMEARVELPDDVVDTESNLSSVVLMKNLFKLGLNYMPWSIAGGAGMASPAAESLHLMAGRIAGGAGLAWLAATLLHHVPGRLAGRGTLREGDCSRAEKETRSGNDRDDSGAHRFFSSRERPSQAETPQRERRSVEAYGSHYVKDGRGLTASLETPPARRSSPRRQNPAAA